LKGREEGASESARLERFFLAHKFKLGTSQTSHSVHLPVLHILPQFPEDLEQMVLEYMVVDEKSLVRLLKTIGLFQPFPHPDPNPADECGCYYFRTSKIWIECLGPEQIVWIPVVQQLIPVARLVKRKWALKRQMGEKDEKETLVEKENLAQLFMAFHFKEVRNLCEAESKSIQDLCQSCGLFLVKVQGGYLLGSTEG
jgi:hypothetical protein